jgi:predicted unusual protein kinase regulating ubiquinone biosynthesis (AarF/ABC1/UbiB family)
MGVFEKFGTSNCAVPLPTRANITDADKLDLADSLARADLRHFCWNLFFSTDPHPGNLGVEAMDNGKRQTNASTHLLRFCSSGDVESKGRMLSEFMIET